MLGIVDAIRPLCGFTAELEQLLAAGTPARFEVAWTERDLEALGRRALAVARRGDAPLAPVLAELDRTLLAVLDRCRSLPDVHVQTFRVPQLERWQHAAAAALVGARWGVAGLRTVIADATAPLARRYFAFLALAERHPESAWPLFEKYLLTPGAHYAFVGVAAEAARYYDGRARRVLVALFGRIRGDQMLRRFLGPRILESLYVLGDPGALPLFEELVVAGHTDADPERCEVTRALVAVRKLTGRVPENSKFPDSDEPSVREWLDEAEKRFEAERDRLTPVVVI
jgi:hypothetical protein